MRIVLFIGGARSGKSRLALERARALGGGRVTFLATGWAEDEEMARRILRHRAERPPTWQTVEVPPGAGTGDALERAANDVVLLDCLSLLVAGAALAADPEEAAVSAAAERTVTDLLTSATRRGGWLLIVTNEVGMGVVPPSPLGRWFRDAQGRSNQRVAAVAEEVVMTVAGLPVTVKSRG